MTITLSDKAMASVERRARENGFTDAIAFVEDFLEAEAEVETDDIDPEMLEALRESLDDESPSIPLHEAFRRLAEKHNLKCSP